MGQPGEQRRLELVRGFVQHARRLTEGGTKVSVVYAHSKYTLLLKRSEAVAMLSMLIGSIPGGARRRARRAALPRARRAWKAAVVARSLRVTRLGGGEG